MRTMLNFWPASIQTLSAGARWIHWNVASMEQYRQVKGSLDQAFQTKAGVYSKDVLEEAGRTLAKALESIEAKNQKAARESLDKALLQIELARAKMQEREAAEKTAVTRARADKLSQRVAEILAGKGDDK